MASVDPICKVKNQYIMVSDYVIVSVYNSSTCLVLFNPVTTLVSFVYPLSTVFFFYQYIKLAMATQ